MFWDLLKICFTWFHKTCVLRRRESSFYRKVVKFILQPREAQGSLGGAAGGSRGRVYIYIYIYLPDVEVVPRHCTNISRTTTSSQLPYDVKYDFSLELYIILYYIKAGYTINTTIAHKIHGAISDFTMQSQITRCNLRFQFPIPFWSVPL